MSRPRVQHVSIPRPPGSDAQTRAFYGELLRLEELPTPDSIKKYDVIWFRLGDTELHVFRCDEINEHLGRHFCIEVDDLDALRQRLAEAGYAPEDTDIIPNRPRFYCNDPFGNMIEVTTIVGDYRA